MSASPPPSAPAAAPGGAAAADALGGAAAADALRKAGGSGGAATRDDEARCVCGSGEVYGACCGPLHRGEADAPTAERLMRSRFSAFARGDAEYLLHSWHPSTRPRAVELDGDIRWLFLDVLDRVGGGVLDDTGVVEFVAHYRYARPDGSAGKGQQHERSSFERVHGRWRYVGHV